MDPDNQDGNWLLDAKNKCLDNAVKKKSLTINKRTGKSYSVGDLGDNKEQQEKKIVVVKTLKEWLEWPEKLLPSLFYHLLPSEISSIHLLPSERSSILCTCFLQKEV